ncbi:hypothetical protein VAEU17_4400149 [Vibrio aestuarianus]|nr:hypothetical protein VAEU17_4400149 [Vibrio aestuarianus]
MLLDEFTQVTQERENVALTRFDEQFAFVLPEVKAQKINHPWFDFVNKNIF